ncbi:MAG: hypothetical protein KDK39_02495 [Leptospiraceae bacterium]|nr:hypothetical protein [Leptospiraceae bacterium]
MNATHFHLMIIHFPIVLGFMSIVVLLIALLAQNTSLYRLAFGIVLAAGLFAMLAMKSGDGAEHVVEHMAGFSEQLIHHHEDAAKLGLFTLLLAAVLAIAGLVKSQSENLRKWLAVAQIVVMIPGSFLIGRAAMLGGQIRHTEIRSEPDGALDATNNSESGDNHAIKAEGDEDDDDDDDDN